MKRALFVGVLVGCARQATTRPVVVDVAIPPLGDAGTAAAVTSGHDECRKRIAAGTVRKDTPSCYVDQDVSGLEGILVYPCSGDGRAFAELGRLRYEGEIARGRLLLENRTELDWDDGCRWRTIAQVQGPPAEALSWRYHDEVVSGDDCSGTCEANAEIRFGPKASTSDDQ